MTRICILLLIVALSCNAVSATDSPSTVWSETKKPWNYQSWEKLSGSPETIDLSPTDLAPVGTPKSSTRNVLRRLVGNTFGNPAGTAASLGVVYMLVKNLEENRRAAAYAIQQMKKDGVPFTPQNLQEWLAAHNGIDLAPPPASSVLGSNANIQGYQFNNLNGDYGVQTHSKEPSCKASSPCRSGSNYVVYEILTHPSATVWTVHVLSYAGYAGYVGPAEFDKTLHPEVFSPENMPGKIVDAMFDDGLDNFDIILEKTDQPLVDSEQYNCVAIVDGCDYTHSGITFDEYVTEDGSTVHIPTGVFPSDELFAKLQVPSGPTINVVTDRGITSISNTFSKEFTDNGIPSGSTIKNVNTKNGQVNYTAPDGKDYTSYVSPETAQALAASLPVYNAASNSTTNVITNYTAVNHTTLELPEVNVSGELTAKNSTIPLVTEERVATARDRFYAQWELFHDSVSAFFNLSLSGTPDLPVWTWNMVGQTVVINFNNYATQLNYIAIGLVFIVTLLSFVYVFS